MPVTYHIPAPPLAAYVAGLPPFPRMAVLPTPVLHLIVNFDGAYPVYAGRAGGRRTPPGRLRPAARAGR